MAAGGRLLAESEAAWDGYRHGVPDDLARLRDVFWTLSEIASLRTATWFYRLVEGNTNLPGLFRSGFSDAYCAMHVNTTKVRIYQAAKTTAQRLAGRGVDLPEHVQRFCRELRDRKSVV